MVIMAFQVAKTNRSQGLLNGDHGVPGGKDEQEPNAKKQLKSFDDTESDLVPMLLNNLSSWKPLNRKAPFWGVFEPITGEAKSNKAGVLTCLVCKKYPLQHQKIKSEVPYKEKSGTSGLPHMVRKITVPFTQRFGRQRNSRTSPPRSPQDQ